MKLKANEFLSVLKTAFFVDPGKGTFAVGI
jgi:hypothetical protein